MNKNTRVLLLLFAFIVLVIFGVVFLGGHTDPVRPQDPQAAASPIAEDTEVITHNKDFYAVSTKPKTTQPTHKKQPKPPRKNALKAILIQLKQQLAKKFADIPQLDRAMHALLMDGSISRMEKIDALWGLLQEVGLESDQAKYLLDSLYTLMPIELTDKLIDAYPHLHDPSIQTRLIDTLSNSVNILNPDKQDKEKLDFIVERIQKIETFLKEDALHANDPNVREDGLRAYASIADPDDIKEMITSLDPSVVSAEVRNELLTEAALSTPEAQVQMLPVLIEKMQTDASPEEKERFTRMTLGALNDDAIDPKAQKGLQSYLEDQEPTLDPSLPSTSDTTGDYYTWAKGLAKVRGGTHPLAKIALETDNPLKTSSILVYIDDKTFQQVATSPEAKGLQERLEAAMEDEHIAPQSKTFIKDALDRLKRLTVPKSEGEPRETP